MNRMTTTKLTTNLGRLLAVAALLSLSFATGCKNFFTPITSGTGSSGGTTNSGDYAYVVSSNTSSSTPIYTVSGFTVGAGTLTALSGFPLTLPFAPSTAVVTPGNTFLYVAGAGVLYGYSISSAGALTSIISSTNSAALVNANIVSLDVSPDGQWLMGLDGNLTIPTIDFFQIGSTGQLTVEAPAQYALTNNSAPIIPNSIRVAPTGNYVAISLETGGDVLFGFNTTTGAFTALTQVYTGSASGGDQALAFDSTGSTLYIARSGTGGGVYPYIIGSSGLNSNPVAGAPFVLGKGASSMVIDKTGKYLYVSNRTDNTISAFSIGTGSVLTALSGSPFTAGTSVDSLARDNSGNYILTTAIDGSDDLQIYSFDATVAGKLDLAASAATGDPTEPAGAIEVALTH